MVIDSEKEKYTRVWGQEAWYRNMSPAERDLDYFLDWVQPEVDSSIIDLGCGTGRASFKLWQDYEIDIVLIDTAANCLDPNVAHQASLMDPSFLFYEACLTDLPSYIPVCEYGLCCDVMEHLPTEMVEQALVHMESVVSDGIYFQIALFPHEDYHLTVMPFDWWLNTLSKYFDIARYEANEKHLRCYAKIKGSS